MNKNIQINIGNEPSFVLDYMHRPSGFKSKKPYFNNHLLKILWIKQGEGLWKIKDKNYTFKKNDFFIFNNMEKRSLYVFLKTALISLSINFEPNFIRKYQINLGDDYLKIFFQRKNIFQNIIKTNQKISDILLKHFKNIETEIKEEQKGYYEIIKLNLINLLIYLNRHYQNQIIEKNTIDNRHMTSINKAMTYIDQNLNKDIYLEEVAGIARMSPSYFSTNFKKYNGICLSEYIAKKRIQKAINQLQKNDTTVLAVAQNCGFNSSSNFYKYFKKYTGKTPSSFK